jgi:hypothetical protein
MSVLHHQLAEATGTDARAVSGLLLLATTATCVVALSVIGRIIRELVALLKRLLQLLLVAVVAWLVVMAVWVAMLSDALSVQR